MPDAIERIKKVQGICEQFVYNYNPRPLEEEPIGRVPADIVGFDSRQQRYSLQLVVQVETEWGELVEFEREYKNFNHSWVAHLCDESGIRYPNFDALVGARVWFDVEEIDWDENGAKTVLEADYDRLTER